MGLLAFAPHGEIISNVLLSSPFIPVLVRYRVDHRPKGGRVQLNDGDEEERIDAGKRWLRGGYIDMARRVYRIEGFTGFMKGTMASILWNVSFGLARILMDVFKSMGAQFSSVVPSLLYLVTFFGWVFLISVPLETIYRRAIVTPYHLPWCDAPLALRVLLSPMERRRPDQLFRNPGLSAVQALRMLVSFLKWSYIWSVMPSTIVAAGPWYSLAVSLAVIAATTIVLTPLEVVCARLMVQRNGEDADLGVLESGQQGGLISGWSGGSETVVQLRDERCPYSGCWDALRRVVAEEGVGALYRGWWVTLLIY